GPQGHLVSGIGYQLFMLQAVGCTSYRHCSLVLKPIIVDNGQVSERDIISIYIHSGNAPIVLMKAPPFVSCYRLCYYCRILVFPFNYNIALTNKYLFMINSLLYVDR